MRLLITGGAGFIGSSIALALAERHPDWTITTLDNLYRRGSELNLPRLKAAGVRFVHGDIRIADDLAGLEPFDALVECSAEPSVRAEGDLLVPVNLTGAHHCFQAAARHDAHVVFLSTSRVYPIEPIESLTYDEHATRFEPADDASVLGAGPEGIAESFPLAGRRTVYGATKLAAELLLAESEGPWTINRFGVVAGPWQMGKVDQGVFTHWLISALFDRPLKYFGYDGSGRQVRDLLHVLDAVDLVEQQLLDPAKWTGRTFNAGGGRANSLSLLELTHAVEAITGRSLDVGSQLGTHPTDVRWYVTDNSAVTEFSGWTPQRSATDTLADIHGWLVEHEAAVLNSLS
ncbi:MAG: NAD-dependent epimerase/dehydratase family protein [Patulibacter minatonensis]